MPYDLTTWDRNCTEEQATPIEGAISGTVPNWLRGSFILNGPGKMKFGDQEYNHIFDGMAILQKFDFTETGPSYSSKFLRSNAFALNTENQSIVVSEFGTKGTNHEKKGFAKLSSKLAVTVTDNAPLNIAYYGKELCANSEIAILHKVNPVTLEPKQTIDLNKEVGALTQCPHPVRMKDGQTIALFAGTGPTGPRHEIYSFPNDSSDPFTKHNKLGTIDTRWKLNPCHVHSFAATPNYIIIPEQPFTMDVKSLIANTVKDKPLIEGLEWLKDKQVKFRVVSRDTGKEIKLRFKADPFFYLHVVNAYEEKGHLVLDINTFHGPDVIYISFLKKLRNEMNELYKTTDTGRIYRFIIPINCKDKSSPDENLVTLPGEKATAYRQKDGVIHLNAHQFGEGAYEFPTFNPNFIGEKYNYFYGTAFDIKSEYGKVGKVNLATGEIKEWTREKLFACVCAFVPRPGATAEDDGVVLVSNLHGGADRSKTTMVILDAATMTELASIEYTTQSEVCRALHGVFL